MFNDESTHKERVQVLQSLMAKGTSDVGSGVHTPREINQLLARNDAEFRTFQQVPAPACCPVPQIRIPCAFNSSVPTNTFQSPTQ